MKLTIKPFNKSIFKSTMKLNIWVALLNFAILFMSILLPLMAAKSAIDYSPEEYKNIIRSIITFRHGGINPLITMIIPVVIGIFVTRFMQNKAQSVHIHSMPVKKQEIYFTNIISGAVILVLPIMLTVLGMLAILGYGDFNRFMPDIMNWTYISFALQFITYAVTVFMGTIISNSTIQTIFTYVFMVFPIGIYLLLAYTLKVLSVGYSTVGVERTESLAMKLSILPQIFISATRGIENNIENNLYLIYIIVAIIILKTSYFIYKKRKVEKAGDVVAFKGLVPIIKYGITFCFMILVGLIVYMIYEQSLVHMLVAYFITAIIAYFLSEMLIRKSVRVLDSYKGCIGYLVVITILIVGIIYDITGFATKVPNIANVESVEYILNTKYFGKASLKDEENKQAVMDIHRLIVDNNAYKREYDKGGYNTISFEYVLKNGQKIKREFKMENDNNLRNKIAEIDAKIFATEEFKKKVYKVFNEYDIDKVNNIRILNRSKKTSYENAVYITNKKHIEELLDIMRKDTLNLTLEQTMIANSTEDNIGIEIEYRKSDFQNKYVTYRYNNKETWTEYFEYETEFKSTKAWLIEHNYFPKAQD